MVLAVDVSPNEDAARVAFEAAVLEVAVDVATVCDW